MPLFYKQNKKGRPVPGSNKTATSRPPGLVGWAETPAVVNSPVPDEFKTSFSGTKRFFVELDANSEVIDGSLIAETDIPEGNYLEVFANRTVTLPLESEQNNGAEDDEEDPDEEEFRLSADFTANGFKTITSGNRTSVVN